MRRIVFFAVFVLISASLAETYRLLDTPRCVIDLDVPKNIINVSKCPIFQDQYYGDSTFSAMIACHDTESLNSEMDINIIPKSINARENERKNYFEVTERTNYSFAVDFVYKMAKREPIVFSSETFFEWIRKGRIDRCQFQLESPKNVRKIGK